MLGKLQGRWAPRPSAGPHPTWVVVTMQRLIKVDGKARTDMFYPAGFMDVIQIEKTKENFRMLYDCKGKFVLHKIHKEEATPLDLCYGPGSTKRRMTPPHLTPPLPPPQKKVL